MAYRRLKQQAGLLPVNDEEPVWEILDSVLAQSSGGAENPAAGQQIAGVEGAFLVPDVLAPAECDALVSLAESLGFSAGETLVEVPTSVRCNEVALLIPPVEMVVELSSRLESLVPSRGDGATKRCDPDFINRRWRVYKYTPPAPGATDGSGSFFKPHYDAAQPKSGVRDGVLIDDEPEKGIVRMSQMSVLLYLTEGHEGGETVFYPSGDATGEGAVRVCPRRGAALCFPHGNHPLSPLHEGSPLRSGVSEAFPKYVIRTDVLYATEPPQHNSAEWKSSNYAAAMLKAMQQGNGHPLFNST